MQLSPSPVADIRELTALRAIAALLVVIYHVSEAELAPSTLQITFVKNGYLGVDLFFVLSGFIIMHVYGQTRPAGRLGMVTYMGRRIARLYPVHLVLTLATVALYAVAAHLGLLVQGRMMAWDDLPAHLLLVHAWGATDGLAWNGPSWSISAELFAYLVFPLLAAVLRRGPALGAVALAIGAFLGTAVALEQLMGITLTRMSWNFGALRALLGFAMGVALYRAFRARPPDPRASVALAAGGSLAALAGLATALPDPLVVLSFLPLIAGLAGLAHHDLRSPLRAPSLVYLGKISYSTYMVHVVAATVLFNAYKLFIPHDGTLSGGAVFVYLLLVYTTSALLFHLVEEPSRRWLNTTLLQAQLGSRQVTG